MEEPQKKLEGNSRRIGVIYGAVIFLLLDPQFMAVETIAKRRSLHGQVILVYPICKENVGVPSSSIVSVGGEH